MQNLINLYYMGHIGNSRIIVAFGLGNLIEGLFVAAVIFGFNATSENEFGKAYGAGNMKHVGVYLNRGKLILSVAMIFCLAAIFNTKLILVAL